jgi:hypothetical protein
VSGIAVLVTVGDVEAVPLPGSPVPTVRAVSFPNFDIPPSGQAEGQCQRRRLLPFRGALHPPLFQGAPVMTPQQLRHTRLWRLVFGRASDDPDRGLIFCNEELVGAIFTDERLMPGPFTNEELVPDTSDCRCSK